MRKQHVAGFAGLIVAGASLAGCQMGGSGGLASRSPATGAPTGQAWSQQPQRPALGSRGTDGSAEQFASSQASANGGIVQASAQVAAPSLRIGLADLRARLDRGEKVLFLDARGQQAWDTSTVKVAGAVRADAASVSTWPVKDQLVVAYCT